MLAGTLLTIGFFLFAFLIGTGFFLVGTYNKLVTFRNRYKNAFSQIDVQLKRRYDLIPNLVETAKGYLKHEKETLEAVIAARNGALSASQKAAANPGSSEMAGLIAAEGVLGGAMGRFMALSESYPELKGNENMRSLMEELTSTENRIGFARQAFNDAVTTYNTAKQKFPAVLIANSMNFSDAQLFEVTAPKEREAVKVQF